MELQVVRGELQKVVWILLQTKRPSHCTCAANVLVKLISNEKRRVQPPPPTDKRVRHHSPKSPLNILQIMNINVLIFDFCLKPNL